MPPFNSTTSRERIRRHSWGHVILYLTAVMDLSSRNALSWWLSNTLTGDFCVQALGGWLRAAE